MATVLMRSSAGVLALGMMVLAANAQADDTLAPPRDDSAAVAAAKVPRRRGGFTFGIDAGLGLASIAGYPNDVKEIGYARYYRATGVRSSTVLEGWIGGAFSDLFTFELGLTNSVLLGTGGDTSKSFGGIFRIEAFPLFTFGGHLRDLGVRFDAGVGSGSVSDRLGTKLVDSSFASIFGGGIFYEGFRARKFAHGPFLMGNYLWSDTALRPGIFIGWRSVLYTKP
jgi:hypothetical protein